MFFKIFLTIDFLLSKKASLLSSLPITSVSIGFTIKGNTLNEIDEIKKSDGTPFKVFTPFWRNAEKYYIEKIPPKEKTIKKCLRKKNYFQNPIKSKEILPKKNWFKNFEKIWSPSEESALKELKNFIKNSKK